MRYGWLLVLCLLGQTLPAIGADIHQYRTKTTRLQPSQKKGGSSRAGEGIRSTFPRLKRCTALDPAGVEAYRKAILRFNPRLTGRQSAAQARSILEAGLRYSVDARLIMAISYVRTKFNPNAPERNGDYTAQRVRSVLEALRGKHRWQIPYKPDVIAWIVTGYSGGKGSLSKYKGTPATLKLRHEVLKVCTLYRVLCDLSPAEGWSAYYAFWGMSWGPVRAARLRDGDIARLRQVLASLNQEIASRAGSIKDKESGISGLERNINSLEGDANRLKGDIRSGESDILSLKGKLRSEESGRQRIEQAIEEKKRGIERLEQAIKEKRQAITRIDLKKNLANTDEERRRLEDEKRSLEWEIRSLESDARNLESALRNLRSDLRNPERGIETAERDRQRKEEALGTGKRKIEEIEQDITAQKSTIRRLEQEKDRLNREVRQLDQDRQRVEQQLRHMELEREAIDRRIGRLLIP